MGLIRTSQTALGRDFVVLQLIRGEHLVRPVTWECGVPFAAPYLPETAAQLLPAGKCEGGGYILRWLPASPRMQAFFATTQQGEKGQ